MISKYFSSLWLDKDGSSNNLTLDQQNAGELKAMRAAVAKAVNNRAARVFAEEGFFKCRKIFLDSVIRQNRGTRQSDGTYALDTTSSIIPLYAPGRHMAADAVFRNNHVGMDTLTGAYLMDIAVRLFGSAAEDLVPGSFEAKVETAMVTPMMKSVSTSKFPLLEKKYNDNKISYQKHSGETDCSGLKPTDDWGDTEEGGE